MHSQYKKSLFKPLKKYCNYPTKNSKRFCYYIDLYCFEFLGQIILINLYYVANLKFYKKKKTSNKKNKLTTFRVKHLINYDLNQLTSQEIEKKKDFMYSEFF